MFRPNLMPRLNVEFSDADMRFALDNADNNAIVEDARKLIAETYGFENSKLHFTNTGRTALYLFLKALDLNPGAAVGVQLFTCTVVFEAIKQAGYKPYFLEIDPETYTLAPE